MNRPELIYISDPMCSWCWGFAPVMEAIRRDFGDVLSIEPVMGGLRPGTTEPIGAQWRDTLLHHWHEVHAASGQPFDFTFPLGENFVYDTEPACRAAVTVRTIQPESALAYIESMQRAFYAEGRDITTPDVLAELAGSRGIVGAEFDRLFDSDEMRQKTTADFVRARGMGITGFPAAVLRNGKRLKLLTYGYLPYSELKPRVESWIAAEA